MVFGLFSKDRALQRTIDKATNKLAQQPDRWGALEKLREDGTEEALYGLCKRFGDHRDEGRRGRAGEDLGRRRARREGRRRRCAPLERYMKTAEHSRSRCRCSSGSPITTRVLAIVDELFATEPPGYARLPDRRIDLLKWFSEWKGATDDEVDRAAEAVPDRLRRERPVHRDRRPRRARPHEDREPADRRAASAPRRSPGGSGARSSRCSRRPRRRSATRGQEVAAMLTGPLAEDFKVDGGVVKKRSRSP